MQIEYFTEKYLEKELQSGLVWTIFFPSYNALLMDRFLDTWIQG